MKGKTVKTLVLLGLVCGVVLVACSAKKKQPEVQVKSISSEEAMKKSNVPTLLFHGYKGNGLTFTGMVQRLTRNEYAERSATLTVSPDGEIVEEGKWSSEGNPLIQVIFEDNTNQEWQQAEWIQRVLNYLSDTHQTKEVNLVGHSMGGVSIMRYLANFGVEGSDVTIHKVVTIGAPFNDFNEDNQELTDIAKNGPQVPAPRFVEYDENFGNFPHDVPYLNIAGDVEGDNGSDGTVPVASVVAINYLFEKYQLPYKFVKVDGKTAQHSALHENRKVDKLIAEFLWND